MDIKLASGGDRHSQGSDYSHPEGDNPFIFYDGQYITFGSQLPSYPDQDSGVLLDILVVVLVIKFHDLMSSLASNNTQSHLMKKLEYMM